jgi:hypothetical protein
MMVHAANTTELAALVEALTRRVDALAADNVAMRAEISQRNAPPEVPIKWTPLKHAWRGRLSYETARAWCELGYVKAIKQGGRWLVDPVSLRAAVTSRVSGAA